MWRTFTDKMHNIYWLGTVFTHGWLADNWLRLVVCGMSFFADRSWLTRRPLEKQLVCNSHHIITKTRTCFLWFVLHMLAQLKVFPICLNQLTQLHLIFIKPVNVPIRTSPSNVSKKLIIRNLTYSSWCWTEAKIKHHYLHTVRHCLFHTDIMHWLSIIISVICIKRFIGYNMIL